MRCVTCACACVLCEWYVNMQLWYASLCSPYSHPHLTPPHPPYPTSLTSPHSTTLHPTASLHFKPFLFSSLSILLLHLLLSLSNYKSHSSLPPLPQSPLSPLFHLFLVVTTPLFSQFRLWKPSSLQCSLSSLRESCVVPGEVR